MPSDARSASRRLLRAARPLGPAKSPYYMHNPRPGVERYGPGWYWTPSGAPAPEYLAVNSIDAELFLRELARARDAGDDAEPAGALVTLPGSLQARAAAAAAGLAGAAPILLSGAA